MRGHPAPRELWLKLLIDIYFVYSLKQGTDNSVPCLYYYNVSRETIIVSQKYKNV